MKYLTVLIVLLSASICPAQSSIQDAQARLEAKARQPATQPSPDDKIRQLQAENRKLHADLAEAQEEIRSLRQQLARLAKLAPAPVAPVAPAAAPDAPEGQPTAKGLKLNALGTGFEDDTLLVGASLTEAAKVLGATPKLFASSASGKSYELSNFKLDKRGGSYQSYMLIVRGGEIATFDMSVRQWQQGRPRSIDDAAMDHIAGQ